MDNKSEEISMKEIFDILWSRRLLLAGLALACGLISVAIAFLLPEKYEATVLMSPVNEGADASKLGSAGALLSQFGGLAGLGGLNLSGGGRKAESVATLKSAVLTQAFIADNNLLPVLFENKWDSVRQIWESTDAKKIPTLWKGEELFQKKVLAVSEDRKTGLVTLTVTWKDPAAAAAWANELVARANSYLRAKAIEQSNKNLEYLNDQLSKTNVVELQKAIYSLTETEIKKVMIAKGSDEYAFRVIDPARRPERRISPKRPLIVALGVIVGLVLGGMLAFALPQKRVAA